MWRCGWRVGGVVDGESARPVRTMEEAAAAVPDGAIVRLSLPGGGQVRVLKAFAQTPDGQRQEASSVDRAWVRFRNLEVGSTVVLQYAYYPRRGGALAEDYFNDWGFSMAGRHIDRMRWVVADCRTTWGVRSPRRRSSVTSR